MAYDYCNDDFVEAGARLGRLLLQMRDLLNNGNTMLWALLFTIVVECYAFSSDQEVAEAPKFNSSH